MDITRPNDIFVATVNNPQATTYDFISNELSVENTSLFPKEEYKKSDYIQKIFKAEDGKFNDKAFDAYYELAANHYLELANDKYVDNLSEIEYSPFDLRRPEGAKTYDVSVQFQKDLNPFRLTFSKTGVNSIDESGLSLREIAQQGKIFDVKEDKWLDKSANDLGFFKKWFGDTLVYAQWDDDGEAIDPVTGQLEKHAKGDWKYDKNGNLYIETLGDREVFNKQIVNPTDLLTKEGTWFNKVDFFDSDGKEKSAMSTTAKVLAEIAPLMIPGFNVYYGGFKMAMGLAYVLPTFYKAAEGLFKGDNEGGVETDLWKSMNKTQGYLAKYNTRSMSDAGQQDMWNYEQLGGMIGDVFSQIYEQRAAASLSKLFYKINDKEYLERLTTSADKVLREAVASGAIKSKDEYLDLAEKAMRKVTQASDVASKRSNLAKGLSLGYMALTQSADVYGQAIQSGYDRRAAGITALLAASGQYALMANNRMGTWFLDKTTGYTEELNKAQIRRIASSLLDDAQRGINQLSIDKTVGRNILANTAKKFKERVDNLFSIGGGSVAGDVLQRSAGAEIAENIFKRSIIEGVEEVTEQAAIDLSKGIMDVFSELGYTSKQGSFGGWENVFSKKGLETYLVNLVGGMVGGPMFELERSVISPILSGEGISQPAKYDLYNAIMDGRTNEILANIDKRKGSVASTELSPVALDINGNKIYATKTELSQADIVAEAAKQYVKQVDRIMNAENLKGSDEDILRRALMDELYIRDMKKSGADKFILSDYKQIAEEMVSARNQIESINRGMTDENKEQSQAEIGKYKTRLDELREKLDELVTGKKANYYHGLAIFTLNPILHTPFISLSVDEYVKRKYNKDYYSLSQVEKDALLTEFNSAMDTTEANLKNRMKLMYEAFLDIDSKVSRSMKDYDADGYASVRGRFYNILHNIMDENDPFSEGKIPLTVALDRLNQVNRTLIQNGFSGHTLDSQTDISVGDFLVNAGLIELGLTNDEKVQVNRDFLFKVASLLGYTKAESETDEDYLQRLSKELPTEEGKLNVYKHLLGALAKVVPDYKTQSVYNVLGQLEATDTIDENTKNLLVHTFFSEVFNLKEGEDSPYLHKLVGDLAEIKDVENLLTKFDEATLEHRTNLSKGKPITDADKQTVIELIDRIGMPSTEFNLRALQEQIDMFLGENEETIRNETTKANLIIDEAERNARLGQLNMISQSMPNFKVKDFGRNADVLLNPRRELLIRYAQGLIDGNLDFDDEIIQELKKEAEKLENYLVESSYNLSEQEVEELEAKLKQLQDFLTHVENHKKINTLYKKLRELEIELYGWAGKVSIFKLLENNVDAFNKITSVAEFNRTPVEIEQIKKGLFTLETMKAILAAMSTTELSPGNLYGMNVSLNKALEKNGEAPIYELVGSDATAMILKDLNLIERKLNYLRTLAENNSATIVENQLRIQKKVISGILKQALDQNDALSIVNLKIGGKTILSVDDLDRINQIENEEEKLIALENTFYVNYHNLPGTNEEKLDQLFMPFLGETTHAESIRKLVNSPDSNLTEDFTKLELFDWYKHLHYVLGYSVNDSYLDYKNNIKNELSLANDKKAPFYIQQLALRQTLSYFKNKEITSHVVNFLEKGIEDSVDPGITDTKERVKALRERMAKTDRFPIKNVFTIRGSGGTGKSSTLGNLVIRTLIDQEIIGSPINIMAIAPTARTVEVLKRALGRGVTATINYSTSDEFFNTILTPDGSALIKQLYEALATYEGQSINDIVNGKPLVDPEYFVQGKGHGAVLVTKKFLNEFVVKQNPEANPNVIIMDEMSSYNTIEWQILDYISKSDPESINKYDNNYVLLMGDELQRGTVIGNTNFGLEVILAPSTMKLKVPIRAKNVHKNNNNILLEKFTATWRDIAYNGLNDNPTLTLNYSEKGFLSGDKIVNQLTEADLRKLDPNKEIVVITDDGKINEETKALLSRVFGDKVIPVFSSDVKGQEFDQVILMVDLREERPHPYENSKDLNTWLTRAQEATIVVGSPIFNIKNEELLYPGKFTIDQDSIELALNNRNSELTDLTKDMTRPEIVETKTNLVEVENPIILMDDINVPEEPVEVRTVDQVEKKTGGKDKSKALLYSFFNNLGLSVQLESDSTLSNYLDYTISNSDDDSNRRITWGSLVKIMSDKGLLTGTDLFSIPYSYAGDRKLKDIINDYIEFKNHLLFGIVEKKSLPSDLFGSTPYTIAPKDKGFVIRRFTKLGISYGKLKNSTELPNSIYLLGKYITIDDGGVQRRIFISLTALPDPDNKKVIASIDIDKLNKLYAEVNKTGEFVVNDTSALEVYGGVQTVRDASGKAIRLNVPVMVSEVENQFPGVRVEGSEIRVFRDNIDFIREEVSKHFTSEFSEDPKVINWMNYRFRPYIEVSYWSEGNKFKKIVLLEGNKRNLRKLWDEIGLFIEGSNFATADEAERKKIRQEAAHLLSRYRAWELFYDFVRSVPSEDRKALADFIITQHMADNESKYVQTILVNNMMKAILAEVDPNVDFKTFISKNGGIRKILFTLEMPTREEHYTALDVSNIAFFLHKLSTFEDDNVFSKNWSKFMEKEGDKRTIYYSTVIDSIHKREEGANYGTLPVEHAKYYTMNFAIEPNRLLMNMDKVLAPVSKPEKVTTEIPLESKTKLLLQLTYNNVKDNNGNPIKQQLILSEEPKEGEVRIDLTGIDNATKPLYIEKMKQTAKGMLGLLTWELDNGELVTYNYPGAEEEAIHPIDVLTELFSKNRYAEGKVDASGKKVINHTFGDELGVITDKDIKNAQVTCSWK